MRVRADRREWAATRGGFWPVAGVISQAAAAPSVANRASLLRWRVLQLESGIEIAEAVSCAEP